MLSSVTVAVSDPAPLAEGDSGTSNMVFVVTRSGDTTIDVQVNYQTVDGTAHAGVDYQATSGTLDFTPGTSSLSVSDPVIGNTIFQPNRTFSLQLTALPDFSAQQTFATGSHPYSVTTADVNGDGRPDLILASYGSNSVSVLLNTTAPGATTASFGAQRRFATGSNPSSVTSADINGDGKPDLIVANYGASSVSELNTAVTVSGPATGTNPAIGFQLTNLVNSDPATTTQLTSSLNPSPFGRHVTFTATVTPQSGSGTPGGTVSFYDGSTLLGTRTLSGGVASLTTSCLSIGSHTITAVYSGDPNFQGGTSLALIQQVLSAQQQGAAMIDQINQLVSLGSLSNGQANALIAKLNSAIASFNKGQLIAGINELEAFQLQIAAFVRSRRMSSTLAETLIEEDNQMIASALVQFWRDGDEDHDDRGPGDR